MGGRTGRWPARNCRWALQHCSWLQWEDGPGDGRLETAGRHCSTAVGYSVWADREMAGLKLPVGTAALQHACDAELDWEYSDVGKQLPVET